MVLAWHPDYGARAPPLIVWCSCATRHMELASHPSLCLAAGRLVCSFDSLGQTDATFISTTSVQCAPRRASNHMRHTSPAILGAL
eukprot:6818362-Prymnesium_polylepis.4